MKIGNESNGGCTADALAALITIATKLIAVYLYFLVQNLFAKVERIMMFDTFEESVDSLTSSDSQSLLEGF